MGWYPHTKKELIECNLITPGMLSNAKKFEKTIDVPPGYRSDSGEDICYVDDIDPKFHQGDEVPCVWSATLIHIDLIRGDTSDKMLQLRDEDPENFQTFTYSRV